ncbi:MAG: tyrosine-type recombinase/integrase [Fusobacterium gastrosuis]|uniref:tyrosine-type recombinase/integrase n=1 Tax=Fusobacterium gastrosuis TaxID=1755100 RepID=UPI0029770B0D|nr:tyrosine-type recombinase/integrase [Fusobacteriaceae bacterium]MDY4011023.1 tyrosine-type recombinase/integrase [Fusobacterium gastrosuis]MDY5714145.1 tyrosine-type recombinase/integrase [Fusobacterium gastrosuis]
MKKEKIISLPTLNSRIRDRGGVYHLVLYWIDPYTNKQKTKSKATDIQVSEKNSFKKASKAKEEFIAEFYEEFKNLYTSKENEVEKILFLDYLKQSILRYKNRLQYRSFDSYMRNFAVIEKYFITKNLYLQSIKPKHILDFYDYLSLERNVSNNTILHHHVLLRKVFKEAFLKKIIPEDIMLHVPRPKIQKYISEVFTTDELNKFLEIIKGHKFELEFNLAIFYGLRKSEILSLKFSSIDYVDKTININSKITKNEKGELISIKKMKNDSSMRFMPLINIIKKKIVERKKRIENDKKFFKSNYNKKWNDFICVDEEGKLINPDTLTRTFKRVLKENDLKNLRFHDLRHSCATLLYKKGTSLKDIQKYLGHSNISTTANIYSHFDDSQKEKTINVIKNSLLIKEK